MKKLLMMIALGWLSSLPALCQDEAVSKVERFVRERMVFDLQAQYSQQSQWSLVGSELDVGLRIINRFYAYAEAGWLWQLRREDGQREYYKANTLGGGLGYSLIGNREKRMSLDLRLGLSQSVGSSSMNCTVYDSQLRLRLGGIVFVPSIGLGFKHVHSHTSDLPSRNFVYATFGIGL